MFLIREFILFLIPALWIAVMIVSKGDSAWFWYLIPVLFIQQIFTIWYLAKFKFNATFFNLLLSPLLFSFASLCFSILLVSDFLYYGIASVTAFVLYVIVKQYQLYFRYPFKYQPYTLESISLYSAVGSAYFLCTAAFGLAIFTRFSWGLLLLALGICVWSLSYQFFWVNKFDTRKSVLFASTISLIVLQMFFALSYLPTGYFVNGFVLAVCYYAFLGFSKNYLQNTLTKNRIWVYLIVIIAALAATLLTAQWS
jgi:hypothetical protein